MLTDLHTTGCVLELPAADGARYILHGPGGYVAEVEGAQTPLRVVLPPGPYTIERRTPRSVEKDEVILDVNGVTEPRGFQRATFIWADMRGGDYPLHGSLAGIAGPSLLGWNAPVFGGEIAFSHPAGSVDLRPSLQYSIGTVIGNGQRKVLQELRADFAVLFPVAYGGGYLLEVGPSAGLAIAGEADYALHASTQAGETIASGLAIMTFWAGPLRLGPELSAELHILSIDHRTAVEPLLDGGIFFGF